MGTKIARIISIITIVSIVCLLISSCDKRKQPAYFLEAREDTSIVQSYRAYFELDGNSLKEVKQIRYDTLIGRSNNYQEISYQTYNIKAVSTNGNPSDYVYTQSPTDKIAFDKPTLIKNLRKVGVFWTGDIQIRLTVFDGYMILEASHTDGNSVTEYKTGLFRNGKYIEPPKDSSLKSLTNVYKKK